MCVAPIVMVVPSVLQDGLVLDRLFTLESSASSSSDTHSSNYSLSSSSTNSAKLVQGDVNKGEEKGITIYTEREEKCAHPVQGWELMPTHPNLVANIRETPIDFVVGFKFKAMLHHEVVDGKATIKSLRKLDEVVKQY
ncbi:hypothetical protein SLEP1_g22763 [Rubroshorea leprosula]|uniref:Uncharacterized protein n=1 Tax=Rubroshorea leprosula TaxID=152421 RepID=A0AAV5JJF9_9ROSI|nr:hypothetical protein SLEP1_g22763 [Rubroshorea leprosula]